MPTYPIIEQIAQLIKTALEAITEANDYQTTVAEVIRPARTGKIVPQKHLQIVMLQADPTRAEEYDYTGNPPVEGWCQPFTLDLRVVLPESSKTPVDEVTNLFWADVQKCMLAEPHWIDGDGNELAIDTKQADPEHIPRADGGSDGIVLAFNVYYRVRENDPYARVG